MRDGFIQRSAVPPAFNNPEWFLDWLAGDNTSNSSRGTTDMPKPKVFLVLLGWPRSNDPRSDPFYEFGSFGCTSCHCNNLFHPDCASELKGARLAFAQGGAGGFRLVYLTPPVEIRKLPPKSPNRCEAKWKPTEWPFRYTEALAQLCATTDSAISI